MVERLTRFSECGEYTSRTAMQHGSLTKWKSPRILRFLRLVHPETLRQTITINMWFVAPTKGKQYVFTSNFEPSQKWPPGSGRRESWSVRRKWNVATSCPFFADHSQVSTLLRPILHIEPALPHILRSSR